MKKSPWEFFITHYRFTFLLILTLVILGTFSIIKIPKEAQPEIDIPIGFVVTPFPGATAQDVEELVTNIVENKVIGIENVKNVRSISMEGSSQVIVEFSANSDTDTNLLNLKEGIDEILINLPADAKDPIVNKVRFSDFPIYIFSLSGPFTIVELTTFAEQLKEEIESIPNVSKVEIQGDEKREIQIIVNKAILDRFGFSINQITGAIRQANTDIPTGTIESAQTIFTVRLAGRITTAEQIAIIPIATINGVPILIQDVAEVIDGFKEKNTLSTLSIRGSPPLPSISMQVFKSPGGNIIDLVHDTEETIQESYSTFLPAEIQVEVLQDVAKFIREDLGNLLKSGAQTIFIVMLLLFLFLGWREALLASIAIPMAFLITFTILAALGLTLNFLSLFSLVLSLGLLIDSAIIMVEGMNEQMKRYGKNSKDAAIATIRTFQMPLTTGILTTVFAFVPMLLMSGIIGEFVKHIPITVTIALISSLFVAFAIITTVGMKWLKPTPQSSTFPPIKERGPIAAPLFNKLAAWYEETLENFLNTRKTKLIFTGVLILLLIGSFMLPVTGILKLKMFPVTDQDTIFINIVSPLGTPLANTHISVQEIENILVRDERIQSFASTVGATAQTGEDFGNVTSGSHLANIVINLSPERDEKSYIILEEYRRKLKGLVPRTEISVVQQGEGPPTGAPVEIVISGPELNILEDIGQSFETFLNNTPGATNVNSSVQEKTGEFVISIDRAKAQLYGVSTLELAQILRNSVTGTTATVLYEEGKEIDVIVKYALQPETVKNGKTNIINFSTIESMTIPTAVGNIPLSAFTSSELIAGRSSIIHEDGERIIRVTSFTEPGVNAVQIFQKAQEHLDTNIQVPSGYTVRMGGEAEDIEESFNDMFRAMILAIFLIGGVMVLQFRSYRQAAFILVIIPLALIGVFPGLVLVDSDLTFPAIIGIVALTGIVVNDAIILISRINNNRKKGLRKREAVIEGGRARLQPIILTTVTTIGGILPLSLSSEFWAPLGFSIIFGLLFSTVLTLFVIPMLYLKFAEQEIEE